MYLLNCEWTVGGFPWGAVPCTLTDGSVWRDVFYSLAREQLGPVAGAHLTVQDTATLLYTAGVWLGAGPTALRPSLLPVLPDAGSVFRRHRSNRRVAVARGSFNPRPSCDQQC